MRSAKVVKQIAGSGVKSARSFRAIRTGILGSLFPSNYGTVRIAILTPALFTAMARMDVGDGFGSAARLRSHPPAIVSHMPLLNSRQLKARLRDWERLRVADFARVGWVRVEQEHTSIPILPR